MLIKDNQLNNAEFKKFFPKLSWERVPRELSKKHTDYFYVGTYEDKKVKIKASIRPSKIMQLSESFKGFDKNGKKAPKGYRGETYEFGSTVEIQVPDKFIKEVDKASNKKNTNKTNKLEW